MADAPPIPPAAPPVGPYKKPLVLWIAGAMLAILAGFAFVFGESLLYPKWWQGAEIRQPSTRAEIERYKSVARHYAQKSDTLAVTNCKLAPEVLSVPYSHFMTWTHVLSVVNDGERAVFFSSSLKVPAHTRTTVHVKDLVGNVYDFSESRTADTVLTYRCNADNGVSAYGAILAHPD